MNNAGVVHNMSYSYSQLMPYQNSGLSSQYWPSHTNPDNRFAYQGMVQSRSIDGSRLTGGSVMPGVANPPGISSQQNQKKKKRILFSQTQLSELEKRFKIQKYLSPNERDQLAYLTNLSPNQIKIWFQNHRYKHKKAMKENTKLNKRNEKVPPVPKGDDDLRAKDNSDDAGILTSKVIDKLKDLKRKETTEKSENETISDSELSGQNTAHEYETQPEVAVSQQERVHNDWHHPQEREILKEASLPDGHNEINMVKELKHSKPKEQSENDGQLTLNHPIGGQDLKSEKKEGNKRSCSYQPHQNKSQNQEIQPMRQDIKIGDSNHHFKQERMEETHACKSTKQIYNTPYKGTSPLEALDIMASGKHFFADDISWKPHFPPQVNPVRISGGRDDFGGNLSIGVNDGMYIQPVTHFDSSSQAPSFTVELL